MTEPDATAYWTDLLDRLEEGLRDGSPPPTWAPPAEPPPLPPTLTARARRVHGDLGRALERLDADARRVAGELTALPRIPGAGPDPARIVDCSA